MIQMTSTFVGKLHYHTEFNKSTFETTTMKAICREKSKKKKHLDEIS